MATLLQEMAQEKARRLEGERERLVAALRRELAALLPSGEIVFVYGSLTQPGRFADSSDLDLALVRRPPAFSEFWLQGELEMRLGRRVDVVVLAETRLREKIDREGWRWTL
jgi:predicted nucleotidyltransferase